MSEQKPELSRVRRKRQNNKGNKLLNWMIAIVVLLIVLVGVKILSSDSTPEDNRAAISETTPEDDPDSTSPGADESGDEDKADDTDGTGDSKKGSSEEDSTKEGTVNDETEDSDDEAKTKEDKKEGTVTYTASEDAVVDETVSNTSWEPVGTSQTGNHVSQYDGSSVDWQEKQKALAYATGMSQNEMIFWKINNGGSPQKSIGVVSSKDKSEKYRVYLEWVDGEGWKPTQMDVLNTLDFNY